VAASVDLGRWIFGSDAERRFTQDSPVLPEVWLRFGEEPHGRQDLLLTPHQHSNAARLTRALQLVIRHRVLANAAAHALRRRPALLATLMGIIGDFVPPGAAWRNVGM